MVNYVDLLEDFRNLVERDYDLLMCRDVLSDAQQLKFRQLLANIDSRIQFINFQTSFIRS
jgi:hypothetical protein